MLLQSITLQGFKSFGKKVTMDFRQPVTCVVGPNGSGKSNVVEALRFVLGEQSMKSMRGKSGGDLIFKSPTQGGKVAKARVEMVFDNSARSFALAIEDGKHIPLDFETVTIAREVYPDGTNSYTVNGMDVRLKDVTGVLASVALGASHHHIISQGQADRLLSASTKERRQMIEDALGLRVYQVKLKQSEQKLEKTLAHLQEVELLRRELAPHLKHLTKQIERIREGATLRVDLVKKYALYFAYEENVVRSALTQAEDELRRTTDTLHALRSSLPQKTKDVYEPDQAILAEIQQVEQTNKTHESARRELERTIARVETLIVLEEQEMHKERQDVTVTVSTQKMQTTCSTILGHIQRAMSATDMREIRATLQNIDQVVRELQAQCGGDVIDTTTREQTILTLKATLAESIEQSKGYERDYQAGMSRTEALRTQLAQDREMFFMSERQGFIKEQEIKTEETKLMFITEKVAQAKLRKDRFDSDVQEAVALLGQELLQERKELTEVEQIADSEHLRRSIERLKIKVEELGAIGGQEIEADYRETKDRDAFLAKEVADIQASVDGLQTLIVDIRHTVEQSFVGGVEKINGAFKDFFTAMFGGGSAFLTLIAGTKKSKKTDEDDDGGDVAEESPFERGIEIHVSLPQKKVKDLSMLSGGERSLTSIALLFAMSQVNPPPFLVLDETDAALDEANAYRYGEMIARLGQTSQLIVVTHNRETMSRGDVLYGVTLDNDSASRILSIKFSEAEQYAK